MMKKRARWALGVGRWALGVRPWAFGVDAVGRSTHRQDIDSRGTPGPTPKAQGLTPNAQRLIPPVSVWGPPLAGCVAGVALILLLQKWAGGTVSFWPFLLAAPIGLALAYGRGWGCLAAVLAGAGQALYFSPPDASRTLPLTFLVSILVFVATGCLAAVGAATLRRTFAAQREEARMAAAQLRLAAVAGDPSSLPALLASAVWAVPELTGRPACALFLHDAARGQFVLSQQSPPPAGRRAFPMGLALEPEQLPALARAVAARAPVVVERAELEASPYTAVLDVSSAALVPLVNWGRVLGCLVLTADAPSPIVEGTSEGFTEQELALANGIAGQVAVAVENARFYETILTQKEQLERQNAQLAEQKERLEILEKQREDLTHMIVHDLRTPLTAILSGLQMLSEGMMGPLSREGEEVASLSLSSARALLAMVNDLLDVGKIEAGQMVLERAPHHLATIAHAAMDQVRALAKQKQIRLTEAIPTDLAPVLADCEKVQRVLVNLLGNAIKFTPQGGAVTLEARSVGELIRVQVRDTGEGIPAEEHGRIFAKFAQVESRQNGRKMSTGLGLAFCKLAVEAHGGAIGVDSAPGAGSTFWFTLPAAQEGKA